MKKLATLALVLALCVSMTGCGKNNKEAIKNAVDSYFTAMQAGDVQALSAACEEGYSDEMGLVDFEKTLDESFGGDEMGEVLSLIHICPSQSPCLQGGKAAVAL